MKGSDPKEGLGFCRDEGRGSCLPDEGTDGAGSTESTGVRSHCFQGRSSTVHFHLGSYSCCGGWMGQVWEPGCWRMAGMALLLMSSVPLQGVSKVAVHSVVMPLPVITIRQ